MNLYKISKKFNQYIKYTKTILVPDVLKLYINLGYPVLGRHIYESCCITCFNKSIVHKKENCYIGKWREGFYAQDIVNIEKEERCICVNGNANKHQIIADIIINTFLIKDFVFDVYNEKYLLEVNEIHLSSITKEELIYILSQIL